MENQKAKQPDPINQRLDSLEYAMGRTKGETAALWIALNRVIQDHPEPLVLLQTIASALAAFDDRSLFSAKFGDSFRAGFGAACQTVEKWKAALPPSQ